MNAKNQKIRIYFQSFNPIGGRHSSVFSMQRRSIYSQLLRRFSRSSFLRSMSGVMLVFLIVSNIANASAWFVSPSGSVNGAGTIDSPWSLERAILNNDIVQPGDTIWLRGGIYYYEDRRHFKKGYEFDLKGTASLPITIRNFNGERARIDGGMWTDEAKYLHIHGLEIYISEMVAAAAASPDGLRYSTEESSWPTDMGPGGHMAILQGTGIKLINNIIHDARGGVSMWGAVDGDSELYGNIIYDNGWVGPDRFHGPGIYAQNYTKESIHGDAKIFRDNLVLENNSLPLQIYGSSGAYIENFYLEGNVFKPLAGSGRDYCMVGGSRPSKLEANQVIGNMIIDADLRIGLADNNNNAVVTDNTVIDGKIIYAPYNNLIESGNVINPESVKVFLRTNEYEEGRAHLVIHQPVGEIVSMLVDFGSFLSVGDVFRILDPKNVWGAALQVGTYTGSAVNVEVYGQETSIFVITKLPPSEPGPEITISANNNLISDGSVVAQVTNSTKFGNATIGTDGVSNTYFIRNEGSAQLNLTGEPSVSISGSDSNSFFVETQPLLDVLEAGELTSFTVVYSPIADGDHSAIVEIKSDDADEESFTYIISGTGVTGTSQIEPEISLSGNNVLIESGSNTTQTNNHTDFGEVDLDSGSVNRTFRVSNLGSDLLRLEGTPLVTLSGLESDDFVVTAYPDSENVNPGDSELFTIAFSPSETGSRGALVTIESNDLDENRYTFTIQGNGVSSPISQGPEISILGNNNLVLAGSELAQFDNHTHFGGIVIDSDVGTRTFSIRNDGSEPLSFSGDPLISLSGTDVDSFFITSQPSSNSLNPGEVETFTVAFSPSELRTYEAVVSLSSNDADEGDYSFTISGRGLSVAEPEILVSGGDVSVAKSWFVSPTGTPEGDGSFFDPWDLGSALFDNSTVEAGDTIWLRGGSYVYADRSWRSQGFEFNLKGTEQLPIQVRSFNGERVRIDGGLITSYSEYVHFYGLEIFVSEMAAAAASSVDGLRYSGQTGENPTDLPGPRGNITINDGIGIKFINNIIHDCQLGVGFWGYVKGDSEFYGNLIYRNGWVGTDGYYGAGIFAQNYKSDSLHGDQKLIRDNIVINNYAAPLQAYGSTNAYVENILIDGNIFKSLDGSGVDYVLVGGERPSTYEPNQISNNLFLETDLLVGKVDGGESIIVTGNTVLQGAIEYRSFSSLVEADNVVDSSGTTVFFRVNEYDDRRANLAIYQFENGSQTVSVNLSSFLNDGDSYRVLDPEDFWGVPVQSGIFTGSDVDINVEGKDISVFVLEKVSSIESGSILSKFSNYTNFGDRLIGEDPISRIYTIRNEGNSVLNLSGSPIVTLSGPHASDFIINSQPALTGIEGGEFTSFSIAFAPTAAGERSAVVTFNSNDPDEGLFTYLITGVGIQANRAPSLSLVGDKLVIQESRLTFTVEASDPDNPTNKLSFSLDTGAPLGAAITLDGVFSWTPTNDQAPGVYNITIRVFDDGVPSLGDSATIAVTVDVLVDPGDPNSVPTDPLDETFNVNDIGSTNVRGNASYDTSQDLFTLSASGGEIWGKKDDFHYVYREVSGDVEATVKVSSISANSDFSKAGIMFREGSADDTKHVFLGTSVGKGVAMERRHVVGGGTTRSGKGNLPATIWLRLLKIGNYVSAYYSEDGDNWSFLSEDTIDFPDTVFIGLAVASQVEDETVSADFGELHIVELASEEATETFISTDIGNVGLNGSAAYDSGADTFLIEAAGGDIGGARDAFHYVYRSVRGDFEVVAKIKGIVAEQDLGKVGLMVRRGIEPFSQNISVLRSNNMDLISMARMADGADTVTSEINNASDFWLKLTRQGSVFSSYYSTDGLVWDLLNETTMNFPESVFVGMALTSQDKTSLAYAEFEEFRISN